MIRPKPQLIKLQTAATTVTKAMDPAAVLGMAASLRMSPFTAGALASALPKTSTRAICMENSKSPHTPFPQAPATSMGFMPVTGIAATKTMMVRIIQNTNASGRNFCTSFTQPLVNFLNICFYLVSHSLKYRTFHFECFNVILPRMGEIYEIFPMDCIYFFAFATNDSAKEGLEG